MKHIIGLHIKNKSIIVGFLFVVLCFGLTSCSKKPQEEPKDCMAYINPENVNNLLGKEKQEVLTIFQDSFDSQSPSDAEEVALSKDFIYNETTIKITLIFEGDILFRVQYDFGNQNEEALAFTDDVYTVFKKKKKLL